MITSLYSVNLYRRPPRAGRVGSQSREPRGVSASGAPAVAASAAGAGAKAEKVEAAESGPFDGGLGSSLTTPTAIGWSTTRNLRT